MKMEITVTEALKLINEIRQQPSDLFEMIKADVKESVGRYMSELPDTVLYILFFLFALFRFLKSVFVLIFFIILVSIALSFPGRLMNLLVATSQTEYAEKMFDFLIVKSRGTE